MIFKLLKLQWWNWSENRIQKNIAAIQAGRIEDLKLRQLEGESI